MPKVFKNQEEKIEAQLLRLEKQKAYQAIVRHERKKKEELKKPGAYIKFRENFMYEVTGSRKFTNKNYFKHIGFCKLIDMYDAEVACEFCICEKNIRYVFMVEYYNPNNEKKLIFNVGSKCIIECGSDGLKAQYESMIEENRIKDYTCRYCQKVCIHEATGRAYDLYDINMKKCFEGQSIPWCEVCKKEKKQQFYYPKCIKCWKKCVT